MESGALRILDPNIYRRGQRTTALNRWISLGVGALGFLSLWNAPLTSRRGGLAVGALYVINLLAGQAWLRRHPRSRPLKAAQAVADALAVGFAAGFSGGLDSPVWLLLYPHVVAVAVRGGLRYAMWVGALDAAIVLVLTRLTPHQPLGPLHALALLWCAFMGGTMSSYLRQIQEKLYAANQELSTKNDQLSATVSALQASQRQQELALTQLQASEERYRRLLERIQDGVLIIQEGRVVYANQVFANMIQDLPDRLVGTDFRELVPPEDRQDLDERYRNWEESQSVSGSFEARVQARTGGILLVSLKAGSVDFQGRRSVITTIRDVTRERRMEQELKATAQRLAAINEIANAVNLSLTIEDIFKVVAEEARRLVPFERLTIALLPPGGHLVEVVTLGPTGRLPQARLPREEMAWLFKRALSWCAGQEPAPAHLHELLADPTVQSVATVPLLSKNTVIGSLNLGRCQAQSFTDLELAVLEPVARHIAIALDNAQLLEAYKQRSNELESILQIGSVILQRRELSEILPLVARSVNRIMGTQFCLLLLKEGEELKLGAQEGLEPELLQAFKGLRVGQSLSGRVAAAGTPVVVEDMREDPRLQFTEAVRRLGYRSLLCVPLSRGSEVLGTLEVVTKHVHLFSAEEQEMMATFAAEAAIAIDNARLLEEARGLLADMGEANRRLEELDRLRQQYLRNVSHEFRTPLTVIKGYAEYIMDAGANDPKALLDVMRIVVESCDRVIDMVNTLIEVSRVEQGSADQSLEVQHVDLLDMAVSSVAPLRGLAERKGIELALDFPSDPLRLQGDLGLLNHVLRNLVDNALKYSTKGGRVVVRGRGEGEELCLEVEDAGIGIAPEHLSRIFEKFYMVDGGIARRVGGTGVGLYLVREIVRLHKGTVSVRSLPGQGSVFSVWLPRQFQGARPQTALAGSA